MNPARGAIQWRIPIGFLLVPVGLMMMLLPILRESSPVRLAHISNPSHLADWMTGGLATEHKEDQALANLAWIRRLPQDDLIVRFEFAEIIAAIREEEAATKGASWRRIFAKGTRFASSCRLISLPFSNGADRTPSRTMVLQS